MDCNFRMVEKKKPDDGNKKELDKMSSQPKIPMSSSSPTLMTGSGQTTTTPQSVFMQLWKLRKQ